MNNLMVKMLKMAGFKLNENNEWVAETEKGIFLAYEDNDSWTGLPKIMVMDITDDFDDFDYSEAMDFTTYIMMQ
mgnify:CR=1 FL=1